MPVPVKKPMPPTPTPKTIGIVGSRRRASIMDYVTLLALFDLIYQPGDCIVSGGCKTGGDKFADDIAKRRGLTIITHYPLWDGPSGKDPGAGHTRNTKIAEDCDILLALVAEDRTGGAEDTIAKTLAMGKWVITL